MFALFVSLSVALDALWPDALPLPPTVARLGWVPVVLGLLLLITARLQFSKAKTNIYTFDEPGTLVTHGVFAISRNPMYLGFTLLLLGIVILQGNLIGLPWVAGFGIIADRWYIAFEERCLREKFHQAFEAYAGRTRRWL